MPKPSRNAPCPCGSGKKHKRCCIDNPPESDDSNISAFPGFKPDLVRHTLENASPDDFVDTAIDLMQGHHLAEAKELLDPILEEDPGHGYANYAMGIYQSKIGELTKAIRHFRIAVDQKPDFAEAWHNLGVAYQKIYEIPQAIKCAKEVLKLGRRRKAFQRDVAENRRFLKEVERFLKQGQGITVDQFLADSTIYADAFEKLEDGELDEALKGFTQVLKSQPKHYQSHGNLALCHAIQGRKQLALDHLDRALEIYPDYEVAASNKILIEKLEEGEKLELEMHTIDYGRPR